MGGNNILDVRAAFAASLDTSPTIIGLSMMHEHYKMGHICAVTMEIAESEIFLHERHANLLEQAS